MSDEEKMMERIGTLVESKLAAFEARLFPGATHQQPLGTTNMVTTKSVQRLPKSAKPKRKKKRAFQPSVIDLPPVTEPVHQLTAPVEQNSWATVAKKPKAQKQPESKDIRYLTKQSGKSKNKVPRAPSFAAVTTPVLQSPETKKGTG
ncbi:unnamed protein product, partial [Iphiclides podalirius]